MKRLLKFTIGLLIVYLIIRVLTEYLRPLRVMLDEPHRSPAPPPDPAPPAARSPAPAPETLGRLNLNQADATALATLPGIGPALAERIVTYRQENGPFATLNDLTRVRGVGPALVKRLRPSVTVTN